MSQHLDFPEQILPPNKPRYVRTDWSRFSESVIDHATGTRAMPFVRYADTCAAAMAGIESLVGLLRMNEINRDRQESGDEPILSPYDTDNLFGLVCVVTQTLLKEADDLSEWAEQHFAQGGTR